MYGKKVSRVMYFIFLLMPLTLSAESVLLRTTEGEEAVEEAFLASLFDEGHIVTSERVEEKGTGESFSGFTYVLYVFSKEAAGEYSVEWKLFKGGKEEKSGRFSARADGEKGVNYLLIGAKGAVKTLFE